MAGRLGRPSTRVLSCDIWVSTDEGSVLPSHHHAVRHERHASTDATFPSGLQRYVRILTKADGLLAPIDAVPSFATTERRWI